MSDVKITVSLDSAAAQAAAKQLDAEVKKLGAGAGAAGKESKSFGQQLTGNLIPAFTAATLAADVIRGGFRFLKDEVRETINAAIDAEKIDRALESSLQIVGQAAGGTAETLKRYASALQKKTVYDDDAIKSAQALIIQMRGTASQVDVLTKGAIGLASVFGMDLQSAARAVVQGFDGNYRAIGMLIPQVRTATTDGEKHAAMMKGLAGYYQRAESEVDTFGGRIAQLKNVYDDIRKTAGNLVIQNKAVLSSLEGIKSIILWLDMQAKKAETGGKKASILDYFGPVALWHGLSSAITATGESAQKAIDDYARSWEGWTASFLGTRGVILDSIPIIVDLRTKFTLLDTAIDAMNWGRHRAEMQAAYNWLYATTTVIEGQALPLAKLTKHYKLFMAELDKLNKKNSWENFAEKATQAVGLVSTAWSGFTNQAATNTTIALDNEYKKRLAHIEATVTDEEAKQKAILALEAEFQIKRTDAARKGAVITKAVNMMEAVTSAYAGAARAFKDFPFPFSAIVSGIVMGLGLAQAALIAKQPIPLARGALFKKPTLMPGGDGRDYALAEAGSSEIVSPEPTMRRIVRDELTRLVPAMAGGSVTFGPGAICIYAQTLDDRTIEKAGYKIYKAIEGQLRIGRRL